MTDILEMLREKNPDIPLYSIYDEAFTPYGQVVACKNPEELSVVLAAQDIPESGNRYSASVPALEAVAAVKTAAFSVFGEMDIQAGCCNGHGHMLNALEYHKCSEVNFTTTGLVLLLALPSDMTDGRLDSSSVKGFYLPAGVMVEIYPRVMHFAPCRICEEGFTCLVVLEKGVNSPASRVDTGADGEEKLFWMRGKWLTCHPDSPQAKLGAFTGISGVNLDLKL